MMLLMLMSVSVAFADNTQDTQTDRKKVIIGFVDSPDQADEDMIKRHGGNTKYTYHIINAKAVEIPEQAIDQIKNNTRVKYVEEDAEVFALDTELDNSWGVDRIDADLVHPYNKGAGVKVAIIDTGIDYTHPDLDGNFNSELLGYDYVNSDNDPMDDAGHGTHCAGIVAAEDNDAGVVGVAPEANLYAVKVLGASGVGYTSDVVKGIEWAVDNNMDVISMSLGGSSLTSLEEACDAAYSNGLVLVASAGNYGVPTGNNPKATTVRYPAAYDSVIAVSATDDTDTIASFSSRGPEVELAAPGVNINSTYLNNAYTLMSGTSMAAPHVSGVAALLISNGLTDPDDIREALQSTAEDKGASGWDTEYGWGIVDAYAALLWPPDPPTAYNQTVEIVQDASVAITLTATDPDEDPLTYSIVSDPSSGALTPDSDFSTSGKLTYMPGTGFTGDDSFTFKANDGTSDSNTATVSIIVTGDITPIPEFPTIALPVISVLGMMYLMTGRKKRSK